MSYDSYVGLALNQSLSGAAWKSGDVSWATGGNLVGNGANAVASNQIGNAIAGNYNALSLHTGQRVYFQQVAGRTDFSQALLDMYIDSDGALNQYAPGTGARARIGSYDLLFIRDMAGASETGVTAHLVDGNYYCLELKRTINANEYAATLYNVANATDASNGVLGTQVATITKVVATAIPAADKRVLLSSQQSQYYTINRVESINGTVAPVTFNGTIPTYNGSLNSPASIATASYFNGNSTPFSYALQAGTLPAGLTLNTSTGVISGTPTATGTQAGIVIRATDASANTASSNAFSINISATNAPPTFPGSIPNVTGVAGTAITPVSTASQFSDTDTLTYSASPAGTAWPSGLVVNASTGVISGTVGTYNAVTVTGLKVRATDTGSNTVDSNAFTANISAAPITFSGPIPDRAGTTTIAASFDNAGYFHGGFTPFSYALHAGVLPAGLTLSASTGIISGTPTTGGTQSGIVVRATDANGNTADTNAYAINIAIYNAPPTFPGSITNITGVAGTAITPLNAAPQFSDTDTLTYSASPAGVAWPSGLTINASTGVISGTVAAATSVTGLVVRATDTANQSVDSNRFNVTIGAANSATGSFTSRRWANNTATGWAPGTAVKWEWYQAGRIGSAPTSVTRGSGSLNGDGTLTISGCPIGTGFLLAAVQGTTYDLDNVFYQPGTVA